jgi:pilus assembly protein HofP
MMKILFISTLLFGCALSAAARDPFAQPLTPCRQSPASLEGWRLQGMVGRDHHYRGWLRSAQGARVTVATDRPSPFDAWQLEEFAPFHLTFSAPQRCMPQRVTLQIRKEYDKDNNGAVISAERRGTGR